jgi:putative oxidoreductase
VVTLVEFLGGIALILGVATRIAAALIAIDMAVAVLAVHLKAGYFMPQGYEYALTLFLTSVGLTLTGPGAFALDHMIPWPRSVEPATVRR